jgi:hypothetical protein
MGSGSGRTLVNAEMESGVFYLFLFFPFNSFILFKLYRRVSFVVEFSIL